MAKYVKPMWKVVIGCIGAALLGIGATFFGWFLMEVMSEQNKVIAMNLIIDDTTGLNMFNESALDNCLPWIIVMVAVAISLFFFKGGSGLLLAHVAAEVLLGVRTDLYNAFMRKDIGWHDLRENSAGILTSTLASDVQLLNGISSDQLQVTIEA